ncbi:MAG: phosphoenolpyruvate--protein phosphotransferase [Phycisphaera sp.]|nr:phosphoenolpyruvate--protein phosphotransferase [Phycisphaera sp.]
MEIKKGIPVSPGVAICPAVVIDAEDLTIPRRVVPDKDVDHQHQRLDDAIESAREQIATLRDNVEKDLGPEPAKIFGFHLGMLHDPTLLDQIHQKIDDEHVTAEYALSQVIRALAQRFLASAEQLFRERVNDLWDLEKRVLHFLVEEVRAEIEHLAHEAVVVAHDLTPSQTAALNKSKVRALVTDAGGRTSHTAIVARAVGIPAVVGLEDITSVVTTSDMVIVDGNRGLVIINPDEEQLEEYRGYLERFHEFEAKLGKVAKLAAETRDKQHIVLMANIEFPNEIPPALAKGAAGIGLYRTEYLFLSTETEPDEEQQYEAFMEAIELLGDHPLTIRTFDLGADKYTQMQAALQERNPFLGCRSIRYCLQNLKLFKTHLRAILRASAHGDVRVMFPLISNMLELRQAKMILNDVMEDLQDEGIKYNPNIKIGMMIEVPSAAMMAKSFATEVDFFSIGTNDLVQYTLAVDRGNEHVASLYSGANPAVLKLIKDVIRAANRANVPVSCCGEMAGELEYVMLMIGMGLRNLSMTPQAIPEIKQLIRSVTMRDCQRVARRVASYDSERQVINYLREETRKVIPEAFDGRSIA